MNRTIARLFVLFLVLFVITGCRNQPDQTTTLPKLNITLETSPNKVSNTTVIVIVKDMQDKPVDNAKIEIMGDMTHAGMVPVSGKIEGGKDGRYSVPMQWSMGGDWILTVKATLPDGTSATKTFNLTLGS